VVDGEQRLRETLLHELCHAAAWVVDGSRKPPHGPHFYAWGRKATAATGLPVTRCHAYAIAFKHTWQCVGWPAASGDGHNGDGNSGALAVAESGSGILVGGGRGCGAVIGRHSRSVDIAKQVRVDGRFTQNRCCCFLFFRSRLSLSSPEHQKKVCGRCRGRLEYAGAAGATGGGDDAPGGDLPRASKRLPSAFALFVQARYGPARLALQHAERARMYALFSLLLISLTLARSR
jgi:predicted SprT family Zn-dependent metalloprotease